jgi:hydroxymethylpyrimidine pyrophosphatase-like HAD family hydrolase
MTPGTAPGYFRALAIDFDGTLSEGGGAPRPEVVDALGDARVAGLRVVLVTGRILAELRSAWPSAGASVDCVVAENGSVLWTPDVHRLLALPVDCRLDRALDAAGVRFRRGQALLAASVADEPAVLRCIRRLELDCQTVANRSELMVLSAGVSKGSGLYRALGHLGLSFHNVIAIGDAENDLSLLERSELAVAVANAVAPVQAMADIVLDEADGAGVASFLGGSVVGRRRLIPSTRWQLHLGMTAGGADVTLPASQVNILVTGGTGQGKSFVAGLLAEQLLDLDYSVLVVDPEGDHVGLGRLPGALVVGGEDELPTPDAVLRLLHHRYASVVVDLSELDARSGAQYQRDLLARVEAHRRETGLPHWVLADEADQLLGPTLPTLAGVEPAYKGYCLVTWRPDALSPQTVAAVDVLVATDPGGPDDTVASLAAAVAEVPRADMARLLAASPHGHAVVARRTGPDRVTPFTVGDRLTPHLRHLHTASTSGGARTRPRVSWPPTWPSSRRS